MKKHRKPKKQTSNKPQLQKAKTRHNDVSAGRRNFLRLTRNIVIGAGVVGGVGYALASNVINTLNEHDLTRVGNGTPTIVQVHDPNCSLCLALQKETRSALKQFQDGRLDYVIANIKSASGRAFANRYGVQHVTLLLFNADGELKNILQGQRGSHQLRAEFSRLLAG
ncbi:thioredoxin family protein [Labrenzia sp. PHM005]|uniref:thioredoxin family protein n=1 Tax=Labrenzia sp. PHM005 TaxID=2590016 RepID=UPI00113FF228|nr:thioredoxin family protein [Labrenzia sp. PHM005]QDG75809.1 thioredoxin family protein [Labrenzia sp. PHM005]